MSYEARTEGTSTLDLDACSTPQVNMKWSNGHVWRCSAINPAPQCAQSITFPKSRQPRNTQHKPAQAKPGRARHLLIFDRFPRSTLFTVDQSMCSMWELASAKSSCCHRLDAKYYATSSRPAPCNDEIRCPHQLLCPESSRECLSAMPSRLFHSGPRP